MSKPVNQETLARVRELFEKDPKISRRACGEALGISPNTARIYLNRLRGAAHGDLDVLSSEQLAVMAYDALKSSPCTPAELAQSLGVGVGRLQDVLNVLKEDYEIQQIGPCLSLARPQAGAIDTDFVKGVGGWIRFGVVSDTHIGNRGFREDACNALYDLFVEEGITQVFMPGNPVDGFLPRINSQDCVNHTPDGQAKMFAALMPRRPNIKTYFITGDDHEGWWIKKGWNYGAYMEKIARDAGREDLVYIGHVEGDVNLKLPDEDVGCIMKVMHPGGGSTYARSYVAQKLVESFQGGEKPAICLLGHYHVHGYFIERNCHCVMAPGVCDQTIFARKLKLRYEVGGAIISMKLDPNGAIARFQVEFNNFFDRGYYQVHLPGDDKVRTQVTVTAPSK